MEELDCTTIDTACTSVAALMRTPRAALVDALLEYSPHQYEEDCGQSEHDSLDVLWHRIFGAHPQPVPRSIVWFHATRVRTGTTFAQGIQPLNGRLGDLIAFVRQCASSLGLSSYKAEAGDELWQWEGGFQRSLKASDPIYWGPYAFLVRDAIVLRRNGTHDYLKAPEIVEDIARELYGRHAQAVLDVFRAETAPCIVHFRDGRPRDDVVSVALKYCYERLHENTPDEITHTCYDSEGAPVSPDAIFRIELLDAGE
jgi:hypothetical protein